VGSDDLFRHVDADWDLDTVRDSDTVGHWDTDWDWDTTRHGHCATALHWNTPALSLNLLLATGSNMSHTNWGNMSHTNWGNMSHSNWGNTSHSNWGTSHSNWSNGTGETSKSTIEPSEPIDKELRISLSLSLSLTLGNNSVKTSVKTQSPDEGTNGSSWSNNIGVSNHLGGHVDLGLDLLADVSHDVLTLLSEGRLRNDLGLSSALLLGGALLLSSALLGVSALGLSVALLLGVHSRDVLALLLSGALSLIMTDLLLHCLANLLRNFFDDVSALCLCGGSTVFLRDIPGRGLTLLLTDSGALLPGLSPGAGDQPGGAGGVCHSLAVGAAHGVVHCPALRTVATLVVVVTISWLRKSERQQANQEQQLHTDGKTSQQDETLS